MSDPKGRLLGIDPGTRRIGYALSDDMQFTVRPLEVWGRRTPEEDLAHLAELIEAHEVVGLVIGVPYRLDGTESASTRRALELVAAIRAAFPDLPVTERDEALTSWEAQARMRALGIEPDKKNVDAYAAAVILREELTLRSE